MHDELSWLCQSIARKHLQFVRIDEYMRKADNWATIDFTNDHDGCMFTATVYRKPAGGLKIASYVSGKSREEFLMNVRRIALLRFHSWLN